MSARAPTILVVDDYADAADTLAEVLALYGYTARAVHTVDAALRAVADGLLTVIVLEPEMGGGAGWELAARLRTCARPPVLVAVTTDHRSKERCRAEGFTAHLLKPCDSNELCNVLAGLLSRTAPV